VDFFLACKPSDQQNALITERRTTYSRMQPTTRRVLIWHFIHTQLFQLPFYGFTWVSQSSPEVSL